LLFTLLFNYVSFILCFSVCRWLIRPPIARFCCVPLLFLVFCFAVIVSYLSVFYVVFLVLLLSIAMVVLGWFSFAVVVISSANSKIFHAVIKCLSSAATFGVGHAASQAVVVCSFVFLFSFSVLLYFCFRLVIAFVVHFFVYM